MLCLSSLTATGAEPREVVVASYNIENYLGATPPEESTPTSSKPKTESAKAALVAIVKEINPDILGVCEMGRAEEFEDFKKRLAQAGLGFTDFEYVPGPDPDRHLALLSRLPITARHSVTDVPYELSGTTQKVKRGFLDVTVRVNDAYDLRLVGVHLKSKRPVPLGEEVERRREAQLLRQHAEQILTADPAVNLLLYGDFNEVKSEPADPGDHRPARQPAAPHRALVARQPGRSLDAVLEGVGHLFAARLFLRQPRPRARNRPRPLRHLSLRALEQSERSPPDLHRDHAGESEVNAAAAGVAPVRLGVPRGDGRLCLSIVEPRAFCIEAAWSSGKGNIRHLTATKKGTPWGALFGVDSLG